MCKAGNIRPVAPHPSAPPLQGGLGPSPSGKALAELTPGRRPGMSDTVPQPAPQGQYHLKPGMSLQGWPRAGAMLGSDSGISGLRAELAFSCWKTSPVDSKRRFASTPRLAAASSMKEAGFPASRALCFQAREKGEKYLGVVLSQGPCP